MKLEKLETLVGTRVTLWAGISTDRTQFETSISVSGILEKHPEREKYRIVNDNGNYGYFEPGDITKIAHKSEGFKDGSNTVIKIEINGKV